MSKSSLPGSMDLLLDTMCNTFGGVVFIAISLSLAFFVSRTKVSENADPAKVRRELQKTRQETVDLESRRESLAARLDELKKLSEQTTHAKSLLPEQVTALEQDCRDAERNLDWQKKRLSERQTRNRKTEEENRKLSAENREQQEKTRSDNRKLREERQQLSSLLMKLNEQLQKTPKKRFHFAHEQRTSSSPYVIVINRNRLHRLGCNYQHSSPDVEVRRDNDHLFLSPKKGTLLSALSDADVRGCLQGFHPSTTFLWIIVHPDSLDAFVEFRRQLRRASYPVHWYVSDTFVLVLGTNAGYSASF